jgi:hypothetical protein
VSEAQAPGRPVLIAILEPGPAARPAPVLARMREALAELGWVEGRTVRDGVVYRAYRCVATDKPQHDSYEMLDHHRW